MSWASKNEGILNVRLEGCASKWLLIYIIPVSGRGCALVVCCYLASSFVGISTHNEPASTRCQGWSLYSLSSCISWLQTVPQVTRTATTSRERGNSKMLWRIVKRWMMRHWCLIGIELQTQMSWYLHQHRLLVMHFKVGFSGEVPVPSLHWNPLLYQQLSRQVQKCKRP